MKNIFTLGSLLFILLASAFKPANRGLDDVIAALNSGNATELAKYVDDTIEIGLPDKTDTYSKAQALMIFRDFFANTGVRSFETKHQGDNAGRQFCIGTLHTRNGDYRTTVFMTSKSGKQLVKEIRLQEM
ncbi:MAG TPA: DUF4783 domain-containing protein [Chitinophagaceae bacterium]|nr:DUF4783 domain-containing protein [Chitinophagaceae bacterium]